MSRWGAEVERGVDCGICIADRGRRCIDEHGRPMTSPHKERRHAYKIRQEHARQLARGEATRASWYERSDS